MSPTRNFSTRPIYLEGHRRPHSCANSNLPPSATFITSIYRACSQLQREIKSAFMLPVDLESQALYSMLASESSQGFRSSLISHCLLPSAVRVGSADDRGNDRAIIVSALFREVWISTGYHLFGWYGVILIIRSQ